MLFFDKIFKKKKKKYAISKQDEKNLVVMFCTKSGEISLNSTLIVPDGFKAIICCNSKLMEEFETGEHVLYIQRLNESIKKHRLEKPTSTGYKKSFNSDIAFVNIAKRKIFDDVKTNKLCFNYQVDYKILDEKKFLQYLFSYRAVFKSQYAENLLMSLIKENVFEIIKNTNNELQIFEQLNQKFLQIGIEILSFNQDGILPSKYLPKIQDLNEVQRAIILNALSKRELDKNKEETKTIIESNDKKDITAFRCDNCGVLLPKGSKRCFNCKKEFKEINYKRVCENCGKEISEQTYVCPYCKNVIIN